MADVIVKHIDDLDSHEPGDDGVTLLALGGKPGAFEANV